MKWWVSLLGCAWVLLSKVGNSTVGLNLRGAFRSFEGDILIMPSAKNAARTLD